MPQSKKAKKHKEQEEARRRCEAEEAQRRKQQEYEAYQQSLRQRLLGFVTDSTAILQNLPKEIKVAEYALDEAEKEFKEGAFAPFWDAIENAATHLARFNFGIQQIHDNSINYQGREE